MGRKAKDKADRARKQNLELFRQRGIVLRAVRYFTKTKESHWQVSLLEIMREVHGRQPWTPDGPDIGLILEAAAKAGLDVRQEDRTLVFYVPGEEDLKKQKSKRGRWHTE